MWNVKGWFAFPVAPRAEQKVLQHLEYKGYETFVPTYKSKRRWKDRAKVVALPLFLSYVFCRAVAVWYSPFPEQSGWWVWVANLR